MTTCSEDVRFRGKIGSERPSGPYDAIDPSRTSRDARFSAARILALSHDGEGRSRAPVRTRSAIMLPYYLRDTGGALATLDFDGDFVGDAQRIGWHVLRRHHLNTAT